MTFKLLLNVSICIDNRLHFCVSFLPEVAGSCCECIPPVLEIFLNLNFTVRVAFG